jgi:hypothetical protein
MRLRKYLGPLPDGAPHTASALGSRYLRTHLSAEIKRIAACAKRTERAGRNGNTSSARQALGAVARPGRGFTKFRTPERAPNSGMRRRSYTLLPKDPPIFNGGLESGDPPTASRGCPTSGRGKKSPKSQRKRKEREGSRRLWKNGPPVEKRTTYQDGPSYTATHNTQYPEPQITRLVHL